MRKQAFVLAAVAAVAIGCGGGGGGGGRTSTTSGSTGEGMTVNLDATQGRVEINYLTGRARVVDEYYLQITRQTISNGPDVDVIRRDAIAPIYIPLETYTTSPKVASMSVPFGITTGGRPNSLNFSVLSFDPNGLYKEDSTGRLVDQGALPDGLPFDLDARIRAFAGRTTSVLLRVNGDDFGVDPTTEAFTFNADTFVERNVSTTGTDPDSEGRVPGRLSDFVRFSLQDLDPSVVRPDLRASNDVGDVITEGARYVYFSGDNVALSNADSGEGSIFQEVGDEFDNYLVGKWRTGISGVTSGTYDLREGVPDLGVDGQLLSIYGGYRDYSLVLKGGGTFEMIMFPNSGETYSFEGSDAGGLRGRLGDLVAIARDAQGRIKNIYFGGADLYGDDPETPEVIENGYFELFPIRALGADPADPDIAAARIRGSLSNYRDQNGTSTANAAAVRKIAFQFTSDVSGVLGFAPTGTVTVFRR